jgi:hypothetical protein
MASGRAAGLAGAPKFVAYYRVSTDQQGRSGLGLDAQREAVARHVMGAGGLIVASFEEIESGKKNDRPQIAAALAACRARRATLVIAKLDRLARNVAFVSNLMEAGGITRARARWARKAAKPHEQALRTDRRAARKCRGACGARHP